MYEAFYGLRHSPFQLTPDPAFLYLSPSHKEAFASIVYGVERRKGFVVVIGEVGLGKTTVLRAYLDSRDRDQLTLIYVFNARVSFQELLENIYRELGIAAPDRSLAGLVNGLHGFLLDEYARGRNVVLVVDEAQLMPIDTLEQMRVLSNLETATAKLLQIVLVGQPEFAAILARHDLRQLEQRIAVRVTLAPLTEGESLAYINSRVQMAGQAVSALFAPRALRRIVQRAGGVPRTINILCDNALITGLGYGASPVTARIVDEVIRDRDGRARKRPVRWIWAAVAVVTIAVAAAVAFFAGRRLPGWTARGVETRAQVEAVPASDGTARR